MKNIIFKTLLLAGLTAMLSGCGSSEDTAALALGEEIVKANCKVCHAQGINGAPIIGNQKMWGPRLSRSQAELAQNAMQGVGLMPAKGGNDALQLAEIEAAVGYMLSQLETKK